MNSQIYGLKIGMPAFLSVCNTVFATEHKKQHFRKESLKIKEKYLDLEISGDHLHFPSHPRFLHLHLANREHPF